MGNLLKTIILGSIKTIVALMLQIIWSPGWGFNSAFFNPLCQILDGYRHFMIDWGYFGRPHLPKIDLSKPLVGIGHSLGFAKLLKLNLPVQGLISLAGFTCFCQNETFQAGTPKRVLERMQGKFRLVPELVLTDFYKLCGYHHSIPLKRELNLKLLQQDLDLLIPLAHPLPTLPFLALAGETDQVCPLPLQQALFNPLSIIQGNHSFPVLRSQETASHIQSFLQNLSY